MWRSIEAKLGQSALSLACCLLVFAVLTACAEQTGETGGEGPERVVAVGSQWYGHLPVWAGMERGIFDRHGFAVEWRFIGKSMDRCHRFG